MLTGKLFVQALKITKIMFYFIKIRYHALIGKKPINLDSTKELTLYILSKLENKYKIMFQAGITKVRKKLKATKNV